MPNRVRRTARKFCPPACTSKTSHSTAHYFLKKETSKTKSNEQGNVEGAQALNEPEDGAESVVGDAASRRELVDERRQRRRRRRRDDDRCAGGVGELSCAERCVARRHRRRIGRHRQSLRHRHRHLRLRSSSASSNTRRRRSLSHSITRPTAQTCLPLVASRRDTARHSSC
jgi:hypothetical protein